jgi:hypothetical protein
MLILDYPIFAMIFRIYPDDVNKAGVPHHALHENFAAGGQAPAHLSAIVDSLDRAMVEAFEVPETDQFVAIHQHQPGELIFDRHYAGGPRSDDFVLFHITTGRTRPHGVQQAFYRRLVERLGAHPGIRPEDVMIVMANSTFDDFSFASGIAASTIPAGQPR